MDSVSMIKKNFPKIITDQRLVGGGVGYTGPTVCPSDATCYGLRYGSEGVVVGV